MVRAGLFIAGITLTLAYSTPVRAEEVGCVTTAWKMLGANHRVCVEAFDDPKVPGVACHLSQARTGGVWGWRRTRRGSRSPADRWGRSPCRIS
jgi:catabolite regulation protein CreA